MFNTISQALAYIESKRTKRSFEDFIKVVKEYHFNTKQKNMIHIAGTNGKGSTVNYLKDILVHHGYTVGTFTSPYMICHNDRICINGIPISDEELLKIINQILPIIEEKQLSMFEIDVLIMLIYFDEQELDYRIIETGIGGRLDKTNVIESRYSAITNIGYDHQFMLGNTLKEIANHKAGIIKPNQIFFTTETDADIISLFSDVCRKQNTVIQTVKPIEIDFIHGGSYQRYNAALAIAIAKQCIELEAIKVQKALDHFHWPGRFEKIGSIYLDGAHNIDGIKALLQTIEDRQLKEVCIIFSALQDKDIEQMLALLNKYPVIKARFDDERFMLNDTMDYKEAITFASKQYQTVIVTGSLHFISKVRKYVLST